jgi:enamine deaminase RidA (YjgF/YER057c/UK114 family)
MARLAALNVLAVLNNHFSGLDQVESILSVTGYVACGSNFSDHPLVINGASDVFAQVFGTEGVHARASVGVSSLPGGAPVEISVIAKARRS